MRVSSRTLACIVAVLPVVSQAPAATAQAIVDTVAAWGLLGTWAIDCARPPSRTNDYMSFVARGKGKVQHERDFGDVRDSREVLAATLTPDGLIEVVADFGSRAGVRKWSLFKGPDGRIRAMESSKFDGTNVTIKDGRFVGKLAGKESAWLARCSGHSLVHLLCAPRAPDALRVHVACPGARA